MITASSFHMLNQPVLSPKSVHVQEGVWSYLHWKESRGRLSNDNSWEGAVRILGARAWNEAGGQGTWRKGG